MHSGIPPGSAQETMWQARNQICISCMHDNCLNNCAITLAPVSIIFNGVIYLLMNIEILMNRKFVLSKKLGFGPE